MSVRLYPEIEKMIDKWADKFADDLADDARHNAPHDTYNLANSIVAIKHGIGKYTVTTNAVGHNGVAYPAKIETGESVQGYQHFYYKRVEIRTRFVNGTSKPNYMYNTVRKYGGH